MFFNGTLKPSPEVSNTDGLLQRSADLMRAQGVRVDVVRTIDKAPHVGDDNPEYR